MKHVVFDHCRIYFKICIQCKLGVANRYLISVFVLHVTGLSMYSDTSSTTGSSGSSDAFSGAPQMVLAHYGSQKNMWSGDMERTKAQNTYKGKITEELWTTPTLGNSDQF